MKVDGKPAMSGTFVLGQGEIAEFALPFGNVKLMFDTSGQHNISFDTSSSLIVIHGPDEELGKSGLLTIPFAGKSQCKFRFAAYSIGNGSSVSRIVHYTAT